MAFPQDIQVNYNDKNQTGNDRKLYADYFREMIQRFGIGAYYYQNNYVTVSAINPYGEDQVTGFDPALPIVMLVDIPNESILFSKFGLQTDADFTAIIAVGDWFKTFGPAISAEPKAGDVVRIMNTGWDEEETSYHYEENPDTFLDILNMNVVNRCKAFKSSGAKNPDGTDVINPDGSNQTFIDSTLTIWPSAGDWRRFPQMYQLTEIRYQDIGSGINFLMGHHVWLIRGKRFDYAYEPNIHPERIRNDGSMDPNDYDTRPGVIDDNQDITDDSDDIFDYIDSPNSDNSPYGGY